jgi:hypothetical protein
MDGLGTLRRIPGDVRRLIYRLRGVSEALCRVSRALYQECQYGLDYRRSTEPITGREVLSLVQHHAARSLILRAMRLCPDSTAAWSGELVMLDFHSRVRPGGTVSVLSVDDVGGGEGVGCEIPWEEARVRLLTMEGELVLERYLALEILERRLLGESKRTRELYAYRQYRRLFRRALGVALAPIGYGVDRFLGVPLREGSLDLLPDARMYLRPPESGPVVAGVDGETLAQALMRLKTIGESYDEIGPRLSLDHGPLTVRIHVAHLRTVAANVKTNLCALRDIRAPRRGPVTARELLDLIRVRGDVASVVFCVPGDLHVYTVMGILTTLFGPAGGNWREEYRTRAERERRRCTDLLVLLGDAELVVDRVTGVEVLGDDGAYAAVVRGQIGRLMEGIMDVDTLLRSGPESHDVYEERYCERNREVRDRKGGPEPRVEGAFRSVLALLQVVHPQAVPMSERELLSEPFGKVTNHVHDELGRLGMTAFMQQDTVLPEETRASLRELLIGGN